MMSYYIIAYDISDKKRLQKIHKLLSKHAVPIQYSVFMFSGNEKNLQKCIDEILKILNNKQDDLRVYPLVEGCKSYHLGPSVFLDGIILSSILDY